MDMQLSGKQAVVTGAGRGIGLAIVEALVSEGVAIVAGAAAQSPTGRFTRPSEVADLVMLLASGRAGNTSAPSS